MLHEQRRISQLYSTQRASTAFHFSQATTLSTGLVLRLTYAATTPLRQPPA